MKRLIVALMLVPAISLPAQEQRTPPVFKAETEVVLVDFVVSADRPVTGLTASDFLVKEDGKKRPIVPQTKPGFRKINVETRTKGLTIRARRGYYDAGR